jgi:hypothetical protein
LTQIKRCDVGSSSPSIAKYFKIAVFPSFKDKVKNPFEG